MSTTDHKVILLTGASRGIGLAIAQFLLKASHKLVLVARSEEPLQKLKAEYPGQVEYLAADLNDFLNGHCTAEEWKTLYDTNVFSAVAFVQAALPSLRKTKGRIIFTSSGAAVGAYSTWGAYGSSKAALHHLTMTLNVEEPDITSISVRPGVVDTDMQKVVRGHSTVMDAKDAEKFKTLHESESALGPVKADPYSMSALYMLNRY
ncbi:putative Uncharacterized oxidoreductase [Glarea lozoyensis 74030]|uniref:Putative Uncharacterized oxidoreductase n=1 Tax=Glarea lozoyensis (strain ATCC 74030 / MF5533) TaxID=1104152 RepID=H0EQY6_GLAL7|nr:putative Uncharacterized oxidoreductase [Glarea lozoyensis 74030]